VSRALERRYQRLLQWYPPEFREQYGAEILGVLMDGAEPGQSRPRLGEVVDVVQAAIMRRMGAVRTATGAGAWLPAAAAVGTLAAVLVLARQARPAVEGGVWSWRFAEQAPITVIGTVGWARLAGWLLIVVALAVGKRSVAAAVAGMAVVAELAMLVIGVGDPSGAGWQLLLAAVVAVLLAGSFLQGTEQDRLSARTWIAAAVAGVCTALSATLEPILARQSGAFVEVGTQLEVNLAIGTASMILLLSVVTVLTLPVVQRGRALVLLATVVVLLATALLLGYDNALSTVMPQAALTGSPAAALVVAAAVAATVLAAGIFVIRAKERIGS